MDWRKAQSGTLAVDYYREGVGLKAAGVLEAGHGNGLVSGSHLNANELCTEVIARCSCDNRTCVSDNTLRDVSVKAVHNLRAGRGYHKKQSDHAGGNTCAAVIAAATG